MSEWNELNDVFAGISGLPEDWLASPPSERHDQEFDVGEALSEFVFQQRIGHDSGEDLFFNWGDVLRNSQPEIVEELVIPAESEGCEETSVPDESSGVVNEFDPLNRESVR